MALTTQSATIGGATKMLIVAADGSSNIAAAHVTVDSSGAEKGVTGNPLAVSAAALPLPTGAATAALQPALNGDGGALAHVTNFPATQPVSGTVAVTGTFWQATQPVSGTVTANAGTGTMAVSAAALPLPSGAATAAKQPALGSAGTPSADVLTVQGSTSMTAVKIDGSAVTQPVSLASLPALAAGSNTIGTVVPSQTSWTAIPTGTFTRPANTTAYASGQLVANSTTAGSVTPISLTVSRATGGTGQVARARLSKSSTSITNASFRVHLYSASPTPANGDGAAWSTSGAVSYLGPMDVTMSKAFTDGASGIGTPNEGAEIQFVCAGGSQLVYALIEARAAYTPTSAETFTLALEVMQD